MNNNEIMDAVMTAGKDQGAVKAMVETVMRWKKEGRLTMAQALGPTAVKITGTVQQLRALGLGNGTGSHKVSELVTGGAKGLEKLYIRQWTKDKPLPREANELRVVTFYNAPADTAPAEKFKQRVEERGFTVTDEYVVEDKRMAFVNITGPRGKPAFEEVRQAITDEPRAKEAAIVALDFGSIKVMEARPRPAGGAKRRVTPTDASTSRRGNAATDAGSRPEGGGPETTDWKREYEREATKLEAVQGLLRNVTKEIKEMQKEFKAMKTELEKTKKELETTKEKLHEAQKGGTTRNQEEPRANQTKEKAAAETQGTRATPSQVSTGPKAPAGLGGARKSARSGTLPKQRADAINMGITVAELDGDQAADESQEGRMSPGSEEDAEKGGQRKRTLSEGESNPPTETSMTGFAEDMGGAESVEESDESDVAAPNKQAREDEPGANDAPGDQ